MGRKRVCEQIVAALRSSLASGERVVSCGPVWATECGGRVPLMFRGRLLHYVAVTDQRLILFRAPRRRHPVTTDNIVIAKRHDSLTLEKTRRILPKLQLRIRGVGDRKFVLEFPPGDRKVGREVASALGGTAAARELQRIEPRGVYARRIRPLAEEIARVLPEVAPWTARPAFDSAVRSLAWAEAEVVLLRARIDEQGILGEDGQPHAAVTLLQRLETQASTLRAELGLTPQALARLLSSFATVATARADNGESAALKAEGQRIIAARQATLGSGEAEETAQLGWSAFVEWMHGLDAQVN
jgi:hypothetical protein